MFELEEEVAIKLLVTEPKCAEMGQSVSWGVSSEKVVQLEVDYI